MSRKQIVNELHKPSRINFIRRKVILKSIDDLWQADLVDMIEFVKLNNGYKYILTVIDGFSKYAWAIPLKHKSSLCVSDAMQNIFDQEKRTPKNLQTDMGKEFYNKTFQNLMKANAINHYSTYTHLKASIVERFNRTLKTKMWKMFSYLGSYKWCDKLKHLLDNYNNTKHRTIKMKPSEVNSSAIEKYLLETVYKNSNQLSLNRYNIGDFVRVSKYKGVFQKGYTPNWSPEIFEIIAVNKKHPVTYVVKDYQNQIIAGRFYEHELQKTKNHTAFLIEKVLKRKGDQIFVKWYGFDNTHNSWINKSSVLKLNKNIY